MCSNRTYARCGTHTSATEEGDTFKAEKKLTAAKMLHLWIKACLALCTGALTWWDVFVVFFILAPMKAILKATAYKEK